MKMSLNTKITITYTVLLILCTVFTFSTAFVFKNSGIAIAMVCFSIMVTALFFGFVSMLKKHMLLILSQLSDLIASLVDMRENEVFPVTNDDMLSKLQTQVMKLSGILRMQNARLKNERDEIKSLVCDISHQLKMPLSNLRLYCGLLQDRSLLPEQREEFMQNMQGQLEKLCFLIENLVKMSRIESGIIQLSSKMESLDKTCLTAIRQVYEKANNKNIQINFESVQDIQFQHDHNWTAEAIFNLLDNAVKYTQNGGRVSVKIEKYELFARVDITDTGLGIDEAEINNIFKRFYRGENARNQEGVGIGLYLAREIVQKQGGYIKVRSKKGEGSKFSLFLPLKE